MKIKGYHKGKLVKEVDKISELYDEGYYHGDVYPDYTIESVKATNEKRMNLVKQFWKGKGKILDVGCALGFFLLIAKNQGFDTYGIDISEYAIQEAKKILGTSVVCNDVEKKIPFRDKFFDVITCWDVIEHLQNPRLFLKRLSRKLRHGGLLFIETLNYESLSRKLMKENWYYFTNGYHPTPCITISILENWLKNASFKKLTTYTQYPLIPLQYLLTTRFHLTHKVIIQRLNHPLNELRGMFCKLLEPLNSNLGDLIYCVARKN